MILDILKSFGVIIAILGIITCFIDSQAASISIIIGSLGWAILGFSVPIKMDDIEALHNRRNMAHDLAKLKYCPMGHRGNYDDSRITTRCKDSGFDLCYKCIQSIMGDDPKERIMSIAEHDALEANNGGEQRKDSGMDTVSTDGISDRN